MFDFGFAFHKKTRYYDTKTYSGVSKKLFVILNAVKDLLFTMLVRPVQSANRSFVPQDDKPFKTSFPSLEFPEFYQLLMTFLLKKKFFVILNDSEGSTPRHVSLPCTVCK
jgi:hypothetical protein